MPQIHELIAMDHDHRLTYDAWPFYGLTRAHTRYQTALSSALEDTGLDPTSWRIVMVLKEERWMTVSDIAAQANSKLSAMTRAIQRMESQGLVELRSGQRDRRATEVALSPAGEALVAPAVDAARHVFNRAFAGFDEEKLTLLRTLLGEMAQNLR
ncbi:MarR family winged helix-turn-helix transcriptional regulator [Novosphingobium decolorationis]|uniref:MarR family transcriptional regulator n=1 Tax=Novosphingobium decolorationis TaxID=2698673 RepID=A0ABX8E6Y2_9SPHN|nr:MarR family transcriptional regulator [Novosphingobium decolorationis]QVM84742.1 MarR family transcriptional regulator [Novosphingobium decolorationis]